MTTSGQRYRGYSKEGGGTLLKRKNFQKGGLNLKGRVYTHFSSVSTFTTVHWSAYNFVNSFILFISLALKFLFIVGCFHFLFLLQISSKISFNYLRSGIIHASISSVFFKKNFMVPFYGWGSIASRLEPLRGGSFQFIPSNSLVNLELKWLYCVERFNNPFRLLTTSLITSILVEMT